MSNSTPGGLACAKSPSCCLPEFSHLGFAAATEPLFIANWLAQRRLFEWHVSFRRRQAGARQQRHDDRRSTAISRRRPTAKTVFVLASFEPDRMRCASAECSRWLKRHRALRRRDRRHRERQSGARRGGPAQRTPGRGALGQLDRLPGALSDDPRRSLQLYVPQRRADHLRRRLRDSRHDGRLDRLARRSRISPPKWRSTCCSGSPRAPSAEQRGASGAGAPELGRRRRRRRKRSCASTSTSRCPAGRSRAASGLSLRQIERRFRDGAATARCCSAIA